MKDERRCLCGKKYGKCKSFALKQVDLLEINDNAVETDFICTLCLGMFTCCDRRGDISYDHKNLFCFECQHLIEDNTFRFIESRKKKFH